MNLLKHWQLSAALRDLFFDHMRNDLEARARLIGATVVNLLRVSPQELQPYCRQLGRQSGSRITVIDPDGKVLADSREDPAKMSNHADRPEIRTALTGRIGMNLRFSNTMGEDMYYVAIPLTSENGQELGALRLAASAGSVVQTMRLMNLKIILCGLLFLILAALASLLVSRRISRWRLSPPFPG